MGAQREPLWGALTPVVSFFNSPHTLSLVVLLPSSHILPSLSSFLFHKNIFLSLLYCDKHHMSCFAMKIRVPYLLFWPIFSEEIWRFEGVGVCLCWKWCYSATRKCSADPCYHHPALYLQMFFCGGDKSAFTETNHPTDRRQLSKRKLFFWNAVIQHRRRVCVVLSKTTIILNFYFLLLSECAKTRRKVVTWKYPEVGEQTRCVDIYSSCNTEFLLSWHIIMKTVIISFSLCFSLSGKPFPVSQSGCRRAPAIVIYGHSFQLCMTIMW